MIKKIQQGMAMEETNAMKSRFQSRKGDHFIAKNLALFWNSMSPWVESITIQSGTELLISLSGQTQVFCFFKKTFLLLYYFWAMIHWYLPAAADYTRVQGVFSWTDGQFCQLPQPRTGEESLSPAQSRCPRLLKLSDTIHMALIQK